MQPSGPAQPIEGFEQDSAGDWVALLGCGHRQHVRHAPPFESRPWVQSEADRAAKIGATLSCHYCLMGRLPSDVSVYKTTAWFDETSIPGGLLRSHRLAPHTWGRIVVTSGTLLYTIERQPEVGFVLSPTLSGVVEPEQPHRVEARGRVRFRVEFLRR